MSRRLSSLLVDAKIVDVARMEQALRTSGSTGDRLGTVLVEMGALDGSTLQRFLSIAHELPEPPPGMLKTIDHTALQVFNVDDAVTFGIIPAQIQGDELSVMVTDPLSTDQIELLTRRCGRSLKQYIIPDFRYQHALSVLYGLPMPARIRAIVEQLPVKVGTSGFTGSFQSVETDMQELGTEQTVSQARSEEESHQYSSHTQTRDELLYGLLGFAGKYLSRRFLLVIQNNELRGYACDGANLDASFFRSIRFDASQFLSGADPNVRRPGAPVDPEKAGLSELYLQAGQVPPTEVLCCTLDIGPRPTLVLVADNKGVPIPPSIRFPIVAAADRVSANLTKLVLQQRTDPTEHVRDQSLTGPAPLVYPATAEDCALQGEKATGDHDMVAEIERLMGDLEPSDRT